MVDFRAVIDDANIINPAFVLHTGDLVNEGELEDYLGWHVFSKAHRIMRELEVPVFVVAGNHDLGGWDSSPPSAGTSRRDWWSFFGWRYLADPPAGDGIYTQNYAFDYGSAHFVGLEAYNNYDSWRYEIYGSDSFTNLQLAWLLNDLAVTPPDMAQILFYHIDFQWQLDLDDLGVDGRWRRRVTVVEVHARMLIKSRNGEVVINRMHFETFKRIILPKRPLPDSYCINMRIHSNQVAAVSNVSENITHRIN